MKKLLFLLVLILLTGCGSKEKFYTNEEKEKVVDQIKEAIKTDDGISHNVWYNYSDNSKHKINVAYYGGDYTDKLVCKNTAHKVILDLMNSDIYSQLAGVDFSFFSPDGEKIYYSIYTKKMPLPEEALTYGLKYDDYFEIYKGKQ